MTALAIVESELETLEVLARTEGRETAAAGFVVPAAEGRLIVRDLAPVPDSAYIVRDSSRIVLHPLFCMDVANRARASGFGVLLGHTHPHGPAHFSSLDDDGELPLQAYFGNRVAGKSHYALLVSDNNVCARPLGTRETVEIRVVGKELRRVPSVPTHHTAISPHHDRQIRAFGVEGQAKIGTLRIAVVGLGGTGSIVARELAHLGVQDFILVDPDRVDESNLNRLLGATPSDIGKPKVEVAARGITRLNSTANILTLCADIVDAQVAAQLLQSDFILSCTDSHASRVVLNAIAYQHLIPCIDMGIAIHAHGGSITHISGRVQMLSPGLPCLTCLNWLDADQVRMEMITPEQRVQDPYFVGHSQPHPAVMSLNGTVASSAVTMFLSATTGLPAEARLIIYDAIRGTMRPTVMTPEPACIVCSRSGALGRGSTWTLPTRDAASGD